MGGMRTTQQAREAAPPPARTTSSSSSPLARLPVELVDRILFRLDDVHDLAAANATSRLFRGAPPAGRSPIEGALRERARARGHERALPAVLPPGVCTWTELLFAREQRVHLLACAHASPIACGLSFSAFVDAEGGLHTCGEEKVRDEDGRETGEFVAPPALGRPGAPVLVVPMRVASLSAVRVIAVAAGWEHLLALSDAGTVYGCGGNECGQLGLGDDYDAERGAYRCVRALAHEHVVCIAAGACHSLALTAAGCAYSWGLNHCGQLGHGDTEQRWEPTRIEALDGVRVGGVSAGDEHSLLLSTSGAVYSCGNGGLGQLGHGDEQEQHTPRRIEALAGVRAVHVSAGGAHSLVVDADGGVHSFGSGWTGCLGHGDCRRLYLPKRVEALSGVVRAVRACAGVSSSAVLGADGSVHAFGLNSGGMLGTGRTDGGELAPARVSALAHTRVLRCAMGQRHSLFETVDGSVYACGAHSAALGLGLRTAVGDDERSHVATPALVGSLRTAFR